MRRRRSSRERRIQVAAQGYTDSMEGGAQPIPWRLTFAMISALSSWITMGYVTMYSSPALPLMEREGVVSKEQGSWFASLVTISAILGAPIGGWLTEAYGRKACILIHSVPYIVGNIWIARASNPVDLYIGRFIGGVGVGMCQCVFTYIAELPPKETRGYFCAMGQVSVVIGCLVVSALGIVLDWRSLSVAGAIPSVFTLVAMVFMPETPRWLMGKRRFHEAREALMSMRNVGQEDKRIDEELEEIRISLESTEEMSLIEIFKPEYYQQMVIGTWLMVFQQLTGVNAISYYMVSVFESAGFKEKGALTAVFILIVQLITSLVVSKCVDSLGRRKLLLYSGWVVVLTCFTFGGYFYALHAGHQLGWLAISSIVVYFIAFCLGWGPIPSMVITEVFPTHARGPANSYTTIVSMIASFIVIKYFVNMQSLLGDGGVFILYGILTIWAQLLVNYYIPETKGKSLEEISSIFNM